jgi:CHAD domain-containing protein
MRAALGSALDQVQANAQALAGGQGDEETVHQLRVGLRRLRSLLRDCAALVPGWPATWQLPLQHAFARLGALRDEHTLAGVVEPLLQAAGAPGVAKAGAPLTGATAPDAAAPDAAGPDATALDASAPDAAAVVLAPDFQLALAALALLVRGDEGFATLSPRRTRQLLARRLARLHRQVMRAGRHFHRLPVQEQHRVRKRLKRLRYLAELCAPLWPGKTGRRYLRALEPAQDALGLHNDIAVAAERLRATASCDARAWFAAGYLQAHLATTGRAGRKALGRVAGTPVFWA